MPEGADTAFPGLLDVLSEASVPLLAAVNGPGVGLGATMLAYFDLVFMAETARLRAPFAAMGVPPEGASSLLFPLRMGWQRAAQVLLSAKWLSAPEALAAGLVTALSRPGCELGDAVAAAHEIAVHDRQSTRTIKALMRSAERDLIVAARTREDDAYRLLFAGEDR